MIAVLIVEDELDVARRLEQLINEADSASQCEIEIVNYFEDAIDAIGRRRYGRIFVDLLLLPAGRQMADGRIADGRNTEPFSPEHWNDFVLEKGGIGFLRHLAMQAEAWDSEPLVVVTSYFDTLPGYARTVRAVESQAHCVLLPKYYKNPVYPDYSQIEVVAGIARSCLQQIVAGNKVDATFYASQLRQTLFEYRCRSLDALSKSSKIASEISHLQETYFVLTWNFTLVVGFDPRGDQALDWECAREHDHYPLSPFYEQWELLRNRILINPDVKVRFWLEVSNTRHPSVERISLDGLSEPAWGVDGIPANSVKRALRLRALISYLAFVAEPPQGLVDYGWTVSPADLQYGSMKDIDAHSLIRFQDGEFVLDWPQSGGEVKVDSFVEMQSGKGGISDFVRQLREGLDAEIDAYYKIHRHGAPFSAKHVLVTSTRSVTDKRKHGYFFNGDLRLEFLDRYQMGREKLVSPDCSLARVFFLPQASKQRFECMDGTYVGADELEDRLSRSFNVVERIADLEEIEIARVRQGEDVLVCVPIDEDGIRGWESQLREEESAAAKLLQGGLRVVLVPSSAAAEAVSQDVFARLDGAGVHCVFTKGLTEIPEVKLIDAVICTGPRIKYRGQLIDTLEFLETWKESAREQLPSFQGAYARLAQAGALGDQRSGSASTKRRQEEFLITSSKTDKQAIAIQDLAMVLSYSPSYNELRWAGQRRPSSSSPWHSCLYANNFGSAILHTHNKTITYCPGLQHLRTAGYSPYGRANLGLQLSGILASEAARMESGARVAILEGHGEVAVGTTIDACAEALVQLHEVAVAHTG